MCAYKCNNNNNRNGTFLCECFHWREKSARRSVLNRAFLRPPPAILKLFILLVFLFPSTLSRVMLLSCFFHSWLTRDKMYVFVWILYTRSLSRLKGKYDDDGSSYIIIYIKKVTGISSRASFFSLPFPLNSKCVRAHVLRVAFTWSAYSPRYVIYESQGLPIFTLTFSSFLGFSCYIKWYALRLTC